MRIACVVEQFPRGSELFIQREVDGLRELGHKVSIWPVRRKIKPTWLEPGWETPFAAGKNFIFPALTAMRKHPALAFRYAYKIAGAARHLAAPDLVYAHFASITAVCAQALAELWGVPLAVSVHARDIFVPWAPGVEATRSAARVFACSEAALARAKELFPGKIGQLLLSHHGLPESAFAGVKENQNPDTILAAGRFVPKKGFEMLLEAIAILKSKGKHIQLRLAGDGPLRARLNFLVNRLGIQDRVHFIGMIAPGALQAEMHRAAIFCAPSVIAPDDDRDGIPNVILEAMAAGLPVLACDAGGIGEVVKEGITGKLIAAGRVDLLAAAIASSLPVSAEAESMADTARDFVRREFSLQTNTARLAENLEKIIKGS